MEIETTQGTDPAEAATLPEGEAPTESAPVTDGKETPPVEAGPDFAKLQKRFDTLTWERHEATRRAERAEQLLQQAIAGRQPQEQKPPVQRPTLAQFDGDEGKFYEALDAYTDKLIEDRISTRFTEREQQTEKQAKVKTFKQREAEFLAKTPDYQSKVYDDAVPISTAMADIIADMDNGPEIAYYLAQNVSLAAQISGLPPVAAAREIGKIEARLAKPTVSPPVSKAPAPPPRIEAVEPDIAIKASDPASDKLTAKQWVKAYEREHRKKRG